MLATWVGSQAGVGWGCRGAARRRVLGGGGGERRACTVPSVLYTLFSTQYISPGGECVNGWGRGGGGGGGGGEAGGGCWVGGV